LENLFLCIISSFGTIFITTFLSLLLYQDVISKEANKIKKTLEKLIDENYKFTKEYKLKLERGYIILKTLINLKSTTKIKFRNDIQLKIFSKEKNYLLVSSSIQNRDNHCNYNSKKNPNNYNDINHLCIENLNNQNNVSYIENSNLWTQKFNCKETNVLDISTSRNLLIDKKLIKKKRILNKFIRDVDIFENDLLHKKYVINYPEKFQYFARKNKIGQGKNLIKYFYLGDRKFIFPGKFINVSCRELYIIKNEQISLTQNFKRFYIKTISLFIFYFIILYYLMILIQNIEINYGDNFIQLCILPFVTTLFMKYLITFNIMMLITSLIIFNFGEYFLNSKKVPLFIYGVSKLFISPLVLNHYYAIKLYQLLK